MTDARRRRVAARAAALLGVLALVLASAVVAAPGAQATTYRYWTYWWGLPGATSWTFASLGPGSDRPKDRSVVGWRFATTTESGGRKAPRTSASWADQCSTPETAGKNRVAVLIDYGTSDDAPPGERPPGSIRVECVLIDSGANGYAALSQAGVVIRARGDGLVCGIDGYPRTECAAAVADPQPSPTRTSAKPRPSTSTPKPAASTKPASSAAASTSATPSRSASAAPSDPASQTPSASAGTNGTSSAPAPDVEPTLPVVSGAPVAAQAPDAGGPSAGFLIGALAVVAVGGAAWWTARGRSS